VVSLLDVTTPGLRPDSATPRSLDELVRAFPELNAKPGVAGVSTGGAAGVLLTGCTLNSREVAPGDLYAALPGAKVHGASFAGQAVAAGAVAVLTDVEGAGQIAEQGLDVAVLVTDDPRGRLGAVAAWIYGDPTADLRLLGITGTNGKTTVAYLVDAGLRGAGETTGLVGTVETRVAGRTIPSTRTTPEAPALQGLFAAMRQAGVTSAAMEVSSHALALHRVDGSHFAGAAFTNLSQDHLDFHADMDDYFEAKALLFTPERSAVAVVDDAAPAGRRLLARRADAVPVSSTGDPGLPGAYWADAVVSEPGRSRFVLRGPHGTAVDVEVPMPGRFNVANTVVALALLAATGVDVESAARGIARLPGVPGRMEKVEAGQPFLAVVDYAHTPAAVETLLASVRSVTAGRVIVVLGCGGDRDRAKRPLMGAAAVSGADVAVLTSDNPRSEDPQTILDAMVRGTDAVAAAERAQLIVELDRRTAIAAAVAEARSGDAVVVAGKGHETGQTIGDVTTPFDDRAVLREALLAAESGAA
jgi:UDP-N-acetylmuramoyl-L-alanyl-D-glutamate--2,6-diaminopimelate ligase